MNKFIKILIASFVLWFIVTLYFYCQHFIFVKRHIVNQEVVFEDATVVINEITLENSRRKHRDYGEKLWFLSTINHFPPKLRIPFLQICEFYSRPYEQTEFWSIKVKGFIITKSPQTNLDSLPYNFYIFDDTGSYYNGSLRTSHRGFSNMYCYEKEGRFYPNGGSSFKLVIEDKENKEVKWLTITPRWKVHMYNFFYKRPSQIGCGPEETIDKLAPLLMQEKTEEVKKHIPPGLHNSFPWENLRHGYWNLFYKGYTDFKGKYKGFDRVYSYNITFAEKTETDFVGVAEQKLYFIIDKDLPWKIIDAGPATKTGGYKSDLTPAYPSTPEEVISAYLESHGEGNKRAEEVYLSEKQKEALNRPNVLRATEPVYKTLSIKTIREDTGAKEKFSRYRNNDKTKVYWVEWYAELTEYGEKVYSRPSGNMSWHFFLVQDSDSRWKIDDWGY